MFMFHYFITGPLPNTLEDFWRKIWEKQLPTIVMLTQCFEGRVSKFYVHRNLMVSYCLLCHRKNVSATGQRISTAHLNLVEG